MIKKLFLIGFVSIFFVSIIFFVFSLLSTNIPKDGVEEVMTVVDKSVSLNKLEESKSVYAKSRSRSRSSSSRSSDYYLSLKDSNNVIHQVEVSRKVYKQSKLYDKIYVVKSKSTNKIVVGKLSDKKSTYRKVIKQLYKKS